MAKKKIDYDKYAAGLFTRTEQYADKVRQHYATAVDELLKLTANGDLGSSGAFSFGDNTKLSEKANNILRGLYSAVYNEIKGGVSSEWEYANLSCDALIESIFGKGLKEDNHFARWFSRNQQAMDSFFKRKSAYGGLNLSQNVWKYVGNLKTEMEVALTVSLGQGDSAATVSRNVRKYLQEPDMMFRRFRVKVGEEKIYDEETGELIGTKPIYGRRWKRKVIDPHTGAVTWENFNPRNYHPGQGVYRSSYKNAMRLTRTETNMAYRSAEQDRWERMDFVVGYRVKRSNHHPAHDICDDLSAANNDDTSTKGVYPKDFVFKGWHPQCRCFVVPILAEQDEFVEMQKAILNGEQPKRSKDLIRKPNDDFYEWWDKNKNRVETATSMPYWVQDNQDYINKKKKIRVKTEEEREAIRKRWAERAIKNQKIIKMATNVANVAQNYPEIDLTKLQEYINAKNVSLANTEARIIAKQVSAIKQDERALSALIPDVHTWKQQFTSAELHQVFDAVEQKMATIASKPLNTWKYSSVLEQQKALIETEIKYVADPTYLKPHTVYPTWKVAQDAYTKQLGIVNYKIGVADIESKLQPVKDYVAKNKGAKKLSELLSNVENDIAAQSDISVISKSYSELDKKWTALQKANATRLAKKGAGDKHVMFGEECFTDARKKNALQFSSADDADNYYFKDAVDAYGKASRTFKEAAEDYTANSSSITRLLRGLDGWLEYDSGYVVRDKPFIEAMTETIARTRLRDDCWIVRDERADFFTLKTGGLDVNVLNRNIDNYAARLKAKYAAKHKKITPALQKEIDDKIEAYKQHEERQLIGRMGTDPSFCSTSSHMNATFSGTGGDNKYNDPKVHLEIYCPKGTQALYAAPYNHYNSKVKGPDGFWDGKSKPGYISEAEIFLQRGSKFRVTEARYDKIEDKWFVKVEVIEQDAKDIVDYERVYDSKKGIYGYKPKYK